jgi:3-deoxy-D-manno-octulosonic-acid transferase
MYLLYSLLLLTALVLSLPWWLARMLIAGKYRAGIGERLGRIPRRLLRTQNKRCIWIHAVSVGEVLAVGGLIAELRANFSEYRLVISTTTAAGQKLARERHGEANVFYFPLDFGFAVRPYLRALRPELVILAETEFWPNFLRLVKQSGAKIAVVNARISDRSLPGYRRWRGLLRRVLANVDLFLTQSEEDKRRLSEIGAPPERVEVSGNLKFDIKIPGSSPIVEQLRNRIAPGAAILICGSTVEGEEFALWGAFQVVLREFPDALMILAPRHPERFEAVATLAESFGAGMPQRSRLVGDMPKINFWRRSQLPANAALRGGVLLLDSIGELAAIYELATIAFVGGSLVPRGGHNILEPAYFGKPILVGPHTENFRDIIKIFVQAKALRVVRAFREGEQKGDLGATLLELLNNPAEREQLGRRARAVIQAHRGATSRTMNAIRILVQGDAASEVAAERMRP